MLRCQFAAVLFQWYYFNIKKFKKSFLNNATIINDIMYTLQSSHRSSIFTGNIRRYNMSAKTENSFHSINHRFVVDCNVIKMRAIYFLKNYNSLWFKTFIWCFFVHCLYIYVPILFICFIDYMVFIDFVVFHLYCILLIFVHYIDSKLYPSQNQFYQKWLQFHVT